MGATFWNILDNEVLKLELPEECETIGNADDLIRIVRSGLIPGCIKIINKFTDNNN